MANESLRSRIDALLSAHHGVITSTDFGSLGLTPRQSQQLVESRGLVRIKRGLYRSPAHPESRLQTMAAACLSHPDVAIGFTTAGREWSIRGMRTDDAIHALVPHGVQIAVPGVVSHRCRRIDPVDVTGRRPDGIKLTSPPRTVLDAASIVGERATESAIEQLLSEQRCTIGTLMATSRRLRHHSRPGSTTFERVITSRPAWRTAARSDLELEIRSAIAAAGIPSPAGNLPLTLPDGSRIEIDLA